MSRRLPVFCLFLCVLFINNLARAAKPIIAIFNLRPTNIEALGYDGELLYSLVSALTRDNSIEIMPRREMEDALLQAGLTQSDNPDHALQAGKALAVNYVLIGQVSKQGLQIKTRLHLLSVAQGRIIKTWSSVFSGREDILNKAPGLARTIVEALHAKHSTIQHIAHTQKQKIQIIIKNLKATCKKNYVVLTWNFNPQDPIARFNVYRAENKNGPYQFIGKTNRNIFEDHKISKGHSYCYMLAALLYNGQEIKLKPIAQVRNVGEKLPHPPLILEAKGFIKRGLLKFIPSLLNEQEGFKIKQYILYRRAEGDDRVKVQEIPARFKSQSELALYAEDTGLQDNTTYEYCLTSLTRKKQSPCSDTVKITTTPRPHLVLARDNLLRRIDLSWHKIENIEGYYLYRRVQGENWQKIARIRKNHQTQYSDKNHLEDGLTYEYYLTAYDSKGETGPSNIISGKTKDLPLPPADISARSGMVKSVLLTWKPISDRDIGGYTIYRGLSPQKMYEIAKVKGFKKASYLDKGRTFEPLEDGQTYYYAIASFNLFKAEGPISRAVKATTKPRPVPVKGFTATPEPDKIVLTWRKNPENDIRAYVIYRSRNTGFWKKLATLPARQTKYEDNDLKPESAYTYKIIAIDKDALESDPAIVEGLKGKE
jgi:fibronectin type 3 domain-containing protein/TolB-like protein